MKTFVIAAILPWLLFCSQAYRGPNRVRPGTTRPMTNFNEETIPLARITGIADTIINIAFSDSVGEKLLDSTSFEGLVSEEKARIIAAYRSRPNVRLVDSLTISKADGEMVLGFSATTCCLNFYDFKNDRCAAPCFTVYRMMARANGPAYGGGSDSYELEQINGVYHFTGRCSPAIY